MAKRRRFTAAFKARVALEALRGDKTVQELAVKHQVHPNQVSTWKGKASDGLVGVFAGEGGGRSQELEKQVKQLHAKIGELVVERDFLASGFER